MISGLIICSYQTTASRRVRNMHCSYSIACIYIAFYTRIALSLYVKQLSDERIQNKTSCRENTYTTVPHKWLWKRVGYGGLVAATCYHR